MYISYVSITLCSLCAFVAARGGTFTCFVLYDVLLLCLVDPVYCPFDVTWNDVFCFALYFK